MSELDDTQTERDGRQIERDSRQVERDDWQEERDNRERERSPGGDFRTRAPLSTHINGSIMHGYVSTNYKIWQVALSWITKLAAIAATTYVTVISIAAPHFREAVREIDAPLEARITIEEKRMDKHEYEVAQRSVNYMTKDEIQREITELQIEIDNLREKLYGMRR